MKKIYLIVLVLVSNLSFAQNYKVVDTGVKDFYNSDSKISAPAENESFYGQDASYSGNQPSYTNNNDGTITDNVTGLMWQQDMGEKMSYTDAFTAAENLTLANYTDWRVPSIKELYSLILFTGSVQGETAVEMFINTDYFTQPLGDTDLGEREIDAQTWSATQYVGTTMNNDITVFGVNFVDGRIKGYPRYQPGNTNVVKTMYFRMVRGNTAYGINDFTDNGNGTVSDEATGLMWQQADDGVMRDWENALAYAEALSLGGYDDWRLPNAKELQTLVDYSRSPQTTSSPAIDPIFSTTEINDPDGNTGQYPYFWTGTSHLDGMNPYSSGVYIAFGEAQGKMNNVLMDVHGAGAQRSDPKSGNEADYPDFFGPQGDVRYVYNAVRCVRNISTTSSIENESELKLSVYPNPAKDKLSISAENDISYIEILDINGRILHKQNLRNSNSDVDISRFSSGIYFISIQTIDGKQKKQKFSILK